MDDTELTVGGAPPSRPASVSAPGSALTPDPEALPPPAAGAEERMARAALSFLAEPGAVLMGRLVRWLGPVDALACIRSGKAPDEIIHTARDQQVFDGWRVRLPASDPEMDLELCRRLNGRVVCPGDPEWPTQLDALDMTAPLVLWLRGPGDLRRLCVRSAAVVGARAATDYGIRVASDLAAELSDRSWSVVSGAALGIDAAAHRGALAATDIRKPARTVAVLACGFDVAYPPRNDALLAEMAQRALLVSEWPPGSHPTRGRFLVRNRVIAALTRGTIVVEADLRSGSLSTAGHAERLNRPVLAVPGPVTSAMSRGCHNWIREGRAVLVSDAAEAAESLAIIGDDLAPEPRGADRPYDRLDPVARQVLDAVPLATTALTEQIAVAAGVDLNTTRSRLALLEVADFITRTPQGWQLTAGTTPPPPHGGGRGLRRSGDGERGR